MPPDIPAEAVQDATRKLLEHLDRCDSPSYQCCAYVTVEAAVTVITEQARAEERARIIADLRRAAAGRREYAQGAPVEARRALLIEAAAFDNAVKLVEGDVLTMTGLLPSWRWTAEETEYIAQSKGDTSDV